MDMIIRFGYFKSFRTRVHGEVVYPGSVSHRRKWKCPGRVLGFSGLSEFGLNVGLAFNGWEFKDRGLEIECVCMRANQQDVVKSN
jgi:hypothetical protein